MAITVPSAAAFKARHPRFAGVADGTVDLYLAEASRSVSDCWDASDAADAMMYLAAHLMVMEGAIAPTKTAMGVGNQIKRVKAGEVETEFSTGASSSGIGGKLWAIYGGTIYGQRYIELATRNCGQGDAAVLVV